MALRDTMAQLSELIDCVSENLKKAARGYKAAAQRVRTGTIQLEKLAKKYRKESIAAEKSGQLKRKSIKKKKSVKGKAARKRK